MKVHVCRHAGKGPKALLRSFEVFVVSEFLVHPHVHTPWKVGIVMLVSLAAVVNIARCIDQYTEEHRLLHGVVRAWRNEREAA